MKKALEAVAAAALLATAQAAWATPSTVYWTPATAYTQPYLVPHLTLDTYVGEQGGLLNDYGLTIGVLPGSLSGDKLQGEVGFDVFLPGGPGKVYLKNTFQLNAKATLVEGALAKWQPGISLGLMGVGFKKDVSNQHLLHLDASKGFSFGTVGAGLYYGAGSKALWTGGDGDVHRAGIMASYVSPDFVIDRPGLNKINFTADLATGKNAFGAIGGGAVVYFTPAIDIITGPVWFLDDDLYGDSQLMWTVQLDVDFDLMKPKK
jgi:hypothetical protein